MATQTRAPTSDIVATGTWTGSAGTRFQAVDDHPDSGGSDLLTHGTATPGHINFGFSAFTVPAGSTAISVQVLYYDRKNASQSCNIAAELRIGSTPTVHAASSHNPTNGSIVLRTDDFTTNPKSSAAWTVDDVNGVGTNGLVGFGWVSTDANPAIDLTSILLQVTYTPPVIPAMVLPPDGAKVWPFGVNRSSPQANGLIAWWPMHPQGGDRVFDLSGYGLHGTLTNMDPATDWVGYGLDFVTDDEVQVADHAALDLRNAVSVAVWLYPRTNTQSGVVEKTVGGTINTQFLLFLDGGFYQWRVIKTGGLQTVTSAVSITQNIWNLVVGTYDGVTARLYVNSEETGTPVSVAAPIDGGSGILKFGRLGGTTYPLNGILGDIRIYARGLSAPEVWQMYNPKTRWDLYAPVRRPRRVLVPAGAVLAVDVSEVLTLSDLVPAFVQAFASVSEIITISDPDPPLRLDLSEILTISDTVPAFVQAFASVAEILTLSDAVVLNLLLQPSVAEILTTSDAATVNVSVFIPLDEILTLSDAVTPWILLTPSVADILTLVDTTTFTGTIRGTAEDILTLDDAVTASMLLRRSVADILTTSDTATVHIFLQPLLADLLTLDELLTVEIPAALEETILLVREDVLTLSDTATVRVLLQPQVDEILTLDDATLSWASAFSSVADVMTLNDTVTVNLLVQISVAEVLTLTEATTDFWAQWVVSLSESVGLTEDVLAGDPVQASLWPSSTVTLSPMSGATMTATTLIPGACYVVGVKTEVLTTVTGVTSLHIGTAVEPTLWGQNISPGAGTQTSLLDMRPLQLPLFITATNVVVTAVGGTMTGGSVRLTLYYATLSQGLRLQPWRQLQVTYPIVTPDPVINELLVPVGSYALGSTIEVLSTVSGAISLAIGNAETTNLWGENFSPTLGTVSTLADQRLVSPPLYPEGSDVVLTSPGVRTGGSVRFTVTYMDLADDWLTATAEVNLSGASVSIPLVSQDAWLIGVDSLVVSGLTGTPTFSIGDVDVPTRWGTGLSVAPLAVSDLRHALGATSPLMSPGITLLVTPSSGNFTGGILRVTAHYALLTEVALPNMPLSVSEILTLSDQVTRMFSVARSVVDVLTLSDTVSLIFQLQPRPAEVLTLVDAVTSRMSMRQQVAEVLTLEETASVHVHSTHSVLDALTLVETLTAHLKVFPSVADILTLADVVSVNVHLMPSVADVLTLDDAATGHVHLMPSVAEMLTLDDFIIRAMALPISVEDSLLLADEVDLSGLEAGDTIGIIRDELLTLSDDAFLTLLVAASLEDVLTLNDLVTVNVLNQPHLEDALTLDDLLTVSLPLMPVMAEILTVSEVATVQVTMTAALEDLLTLVDTVPAFVTMRLSLQESLTLVDASNLNFPVRREIVETLTLNEQVKMHLRIQHQAEDTVTVEDLTPTLGSNTLLVSVLETLTLEDSTTQMEVPSGFDTLVMVYHAFAGRLV